MNNLWTKSSYRSEVQFLIDREIHEYDITKANISILRDANILSEEQYLYFLNAPKSERTVAIGKMQGRDSGITDVLKTGIANARKIFLESNNIPDSNILAIRNDAITYVGRPAMVTTITDKVQFRNVGTYSSFYHINTVDYLYLYDIVSGTECLDIKGLGEESVELHKNFMLEFFSELFYSAQIEGVKSAILLLQLFYSNYVNKLLDVGYYRELNSQSMFKLDKSFSMVNSIFSDNLINSEKKYIDISFNENILRFLNRIYASIYFGKR